MKNIIIDGVEYTPVIKKDEVIAKPIVLHKSLILDFEVYPTDLGEMTWDKAKKACANLGDGWRLPTKDELNLIYENKNVVGGFANDYYWSSTEYDEWRVYAQYFMNGGYLKVISKDNYIYHLRAVRAF